MEYHRHTLAIGRPQSLVFPPLVIADDRVGRVQNVAGGTVVLLQLNDLRPRESTLKVQDIADIGSPELIDGLVIVTHHAEVLVLSGQQLNEAELGRVGVLVLIHHDVFEPLLIILQYIGVGAEQIHSLKDQIVEIQRVVLL